MNKFPLAFSGVGMIVFFLSLLLSATNVFASEPHSYGYGYGYGYEVKADTVDPVISFEYETKKSDAPIMMSIVITDDAGISHNDISISNQTSATVTTFSCEQASSRKVSCSFLVSTSGRVHVRAFDLAGNRENEILRHIEISSTEQEIDVQPAEIEEITEDLTYELYRFWSPSRKGHFYTTSRQERDVVAADANLDYRYEGIAYKVSPVKTQANPQAVYRFWSDVYNKHFYTASDSEKDSVIANNPQWSYEGIAFYGSTALDNASGEMIYRFWSDVFKGHFYTASQTEANQLRIHNSDWIYEGVSWQINSAESMTRESLSMKERCMKNDGIYNIAHEICFSS